MEDPPQPSPEASPKSSPKGKDFSLSFRRGLGRGCGEVWRGSRVSPLLRMGHIRLLQNDWKSSIQHYEQFVNAFCKETGKDIKAALALLDSQWSMVNGQWSMNKDLLLIRDILQAEAEQSAKENPGGTA